jgi:hypothetical protein
MALPVIVHFRESAEVEWSEMTRLLDVTPFGASFATAHQLEVGRLLHMTLPMPRQMRCFDHVADQYKVWALVRYVKPHVSGQGSDKGKLVVGVAFVGKNPPESYDITPGKVYQADAEENAPAAKSTPMMQSAPASQASPATAPAIASGVSGNNSTKTPAAPVKNIPPRNELRKGTRHVMPVDVILEVMDAAGPVASMREQTVTENISRVGASVFTTFHIERGTLVRLTSARYQISVNAFVLARRIGADGIPRLHLKFTDQQWPLED